MDNHYDKGTKGSSPLLALVGIRSGFGFGVRHKRENEGERGRERGERENGVVRTWRRGAGVRPEY